MILSPSHPGSAASVTQVFLYMGLAERLCFTDGIPETQLSRGIASSFSMNCFEENMQSTNPFHWCTHMVPGLQTGWSQPKGYIAMEIHLGFPCTFAKWLRDVTVSGSSQLVFHI